MQAERARRLVIRCMNTLLREQEIAGPLVATYLMGATRSKATNSSQCFGKQLKMRFMLSILIWGIQTISCECGVGNGLSALN